MSGAREAGVESVGCVAVGGDVAYFTVGSRLFCWELDCDPAECLQLPFEPATMSASQSYVVVACAEAVALLAFAEDGSEMVVVSTAVPPGGSTLFPLITHSFVDASESVCSITSMQQVLVFKIPQLEAQCIDASKYHKAPVFMTTVCTDKLYSVSRDNQLLCWSLPTGEMLKDGGIVCASTSVTAMQVCASEGLLVIGAADGTVRLISVAASDTKNFLSVVRVVPLSDSLPQQLLSHSNVGCTVLDVAVVSGAVAVVTTPLGSVALNCLSFAVSLVRSYDIVCGIGACSASGLVLAFFPFSHRMALWREDSFGATRQQQQQQPSAEDVVHAQVSLSPEMLLSIEVRRSSPVDVKAKPVTFHSKIKSSGYAASVPWSVQQKQKAQKVAKAKAAASKSPPAVVEFDVTSPLPTKESSELNALVDQRPVHNGAVTALAFDSAGKALFSGSSDTTVHGLRFPLKRNADGVCFRAHPTQITSLSVSLHAAAPLVLSTSLDGTFAVTKPLQRELPYCSVPTTKEVRCGKFYYLDQFIAIAAAGTISLYRYALDDGADDLDRLRNNSVVRKVCDIATAAQCVPSFDCFNHFTSNLIVWVGSNKQLGVYDVGAAKNIRTVDDAHSRQIHSIEMQTSSQHATTGLADLHLFITAGLDKSAKLWDLRQAAPVRTFAAHSNTSVKTGVALSPCSRFVAIGSEDRSLYCYDKGSGQVMARLPLPEVPAVVRFHPTMPILVAGTNAGGLRFFSV